VLGKPFFVDSLGFEPLPFKSGRQFLHLGWICARAVQKGPACAIDRTGILAIQWQNVPPFASGIVQIDVGQSFPAPADPITSHPISAPRYTTDLMTEFNPGTSPPPVSMPMRFFAMNDSLLRISIKDQCRISVILLSHRVRNGTPSCFARTKTTMDRGAT
jgi:hypothetical protein